MFRAACHQWELVLSHENAIAWDGRPTLLPPRREERRNNSLRLAAAPGLTQIGRRARPEERRAGAA
jgi:hypothetical protein